VGAAGLAGRLAAARAGALVGREPERTVLDRMLSGAADAPLVAYLHGPGGIGKSSLLRYAARQAETAGRPVVHVDARFLDADPRRIEEAAGLACVESGVVLLIDSFEHCQPLEPWLRDTFLLRLADGALIVLASRVAPDADWKLDPGWAALFAELVVRPLDPAQSDTLLAARGVAEEQRGAIVAFAGGSPLVLSLAASVTTAARKTSPLWKPTGDVLTTLVERLVGELPGNAHRRALEVVAQAYVTRESLLRAVLGDEDTAAVFPWLRQLPYVEAIPEGLHPHDAVRATLAADLRWRDPERYEDIRVGVSVACLHAVRAAAEDDALLRVAEWMFLFRDQDDPDDLYDWRAHPHVEDTPLRPGDVPDVLRMAEEAEGTATAVAHWVRSQPQGFRVYRYAGSATPVAFMAVLRLEAPLPADRAADPVIAALWDYVDSVAPLGQGEHLGIRRFAVQPGWHQRPSPIMDLISRRTIATEMRTRGRAVTFTVFEDAERWRDYLAKAGMLEVVAVDVGGRVQHVFGRDWRRQPVEQWVEHRVRAVVEPVAGWPGTPSADSPECGLGEGLPRAAFEEGVIEALRTWRAPREFATSVLLRSRLVPPGSADPVADLRGAITVALDALQVDPAGVKAHEALTATYLSASRTHKATARRLGLPYGTYRRHLALAKERLVEQLLRQTATVPVPSAPRSSPEA